MGDGRSILRLISCGLLIALPIGLPDDALGAVGASIQQRALRIDDTPLFTIGVNPNEPLHDVIGAVLTDDNLIIAEESTHSLRFYDRTTGQLIRTVGQKAEGPGDYGNLGQAAIRFPTWKGSTETTCHASTPSMGGPGRPEGCCGCPNTRDVPGGGSAWTVYSEEGDLVGRVTSSEVDIRVLAVDDDIAVVLVWDELGVQTVQLRRIVGP